MPPLSLLNADADAGSGAGAGAYLMKSETTPATIGDDDE